MIGREDNDASGATVAQSRLASRPEIVGAGDATQLPEPTVSQEFADMDAPIGRRSVKRRGPRYPSTRAVLLSLISASPGAMAACVSLQGSKACNAFQSASVSTDGFLVGLLYVYIQSALGILAVIVQREGILGASLCVLIG